MQLEVVTWQFKDPDQGQLGWGAGALCCLHFVQLTSVNLPLHPCLPCVVSVQPGLHENASSRPLLHGSKGILNIECCFFPLCPALVCPVCPCPFPAPCALPLGLNTGSRLIHVIIFTIFSSVQCMCLKTLLFSIPQRPSLTVSSCVCMCAVEVGGVQKLKNKFETKFNGDKARLFEYQPEAFRWTCCGGRMSVHGCKRASMHAWAYGRIDVCAYG